MKKIIKKLESKKVVSFDIFDTLIKRNVNNPTDVFDIVENYYNSYNKNKIKNFKINRINAEKKCRLNNSKEEITLEDIYKELSKYYNVDIKKLMEIEKKIEVDICQFNNQISEVYNWALSKKDIIITSDMYLDLITIKKILKKANIEYKKIYLSSDLKLTKRTGNIYKQILVDLNIDKGDIIHIGDNIKSDYLSAKKVGIDSIIWKNKKCRNKIDDKTLSENIFNSYFANNYDKNYKKNKFFEEFGYNCFGPLLYSFTKWLKNELENKNITKVFFLSRDGYIMKKAFDLINNNSKIKCYYFFASRRAVIVPSLYKCNNLEEMFDCMHISENISIKSLLKKLGLDDYIEEIKSKKKYDIDIEKKYDLTTILSDIRLRKVFDEYYDVIVKNSIKEYKSFINYAEQMDFKGKVAIVDIGWFGNMQNAIESLGLDINLYGFYMGIEPRKNYQKKYKMYGYLFETNKNINLFLKEHNFNSIFEMIFLAQHGSVKRYDKTKKEMVELYKYEYINKDDEMNIVRIQDGAIKFINDFISSGVTEYLFDDLTFTFNYMCDRILYPDGITAKRIGDLTFMDDDKNYIARPQKLLKYINIKNLIYDYKYSFWRIGFLKRLFKIKLPYYKINMFIRGKYLKKRRKK